MARAALELLTLITSLLLLLSLPKPLLAQLKPLCMSQFALANQACSVLPPAAKHAPRDPAIVVQPQDGDKDDDDGDNNGDEERHGQHRPGNGREHGQEHDDDHGHKRRRKHGRDHKHKRDRRHRHGHGHEHEEPRANKDCCRWLDEVDEECVCQALLRLPQFLLKPDHKYNIKVGTTCELTYTCGGLN